MLMFGRTTMKLRQWWNAFLLTVVSYLFVVVISPVLFVVFLRTTSDDVEEGTDTDHYVTFDTRFISHFGLGNQMFAFAAVVHAAELMGRKVAVSSDQRLTLNEVFELDVAQLAAKELCPCSLFSEAITSAMRYNRRLERLAKYDVKSPARKRSVVLRGFFQSWKYTTSPNVRLRLRFRYRYTDFASTFLADNVPRRWTVGSFARVGVHVRRGDFLRFSHIGFTVAPADYFRRAMGYLVERFVRVQFVICGNDWEWSEPMFRQFEADLGQTVNITYSMDHSPGEDLALLAACDHTIVSTGSFGWWAAWLANGTTVYFADYPRNGSLLHTDFVAEDYFPFQWIGFT